MWSYSRLPATVRTSSQDASVGNEPRNIRPIMLFGGDSFRPLAQLAMLTRSTLQSIARCKAGFNKTPGRFQFCLKFLALVSETAANRRKILGLCGLRPRGSWLRVAGTGGIVTTFRTEAALPPSLRPPLVAVIRTVRLIRTW